MFCSEGLRVQHRVDGGNDYVVWGVPVRIPERSQYATTHKILEASAGVQAFTKTIKSFPSEHRAFVNSLFGGFEHYGQKGWGPFMGTIFNIVERIGQAPTLISSSMKKV